MGIILAWIMKQMGLDSFGAWLFGGLCIVGIALGAFSTWQSVRIADLKKSLSTAQESANTAISEKKQCERDKQITKEASYDYQNKIRDLNNRVAGLISVRRPLDCIAVQSPGPTSGINGNASTGEHGGYDGLSAAALVTYSGQCEKYRLQVIGMQGFIKNVWREHGQ